MADFNIRVKVDSESAQRGVDKVRQSLKRTEISAERLQKTLSRAFKLLGVGAGVRELVRLADTYATLQNRLRVVTKGQQELNQVTEDLFDAAQRTRSGFESTIELYARLAISSQDLGASQKELIRFTESVNKAILLSGVNAQEAKAGLIQLSQGLASGALRGDELRSVLEQLPAVADVIARGLGVTRGALRELGSQGKITAKDILDAFEKAREEIDEKFLKTIPTLSQSFQVLRNSILRVVGEFDTSRGISGSFSRGLLAIAENVEVLVRALGALAIVIGVNLATRAIPRAVTALTAFAGFLNANPFLVLTQLLISIVALLAAFGDELSIASDRLVTVQDVGLATWESLTDGLEALLDFFAANFGEIFEFGKATFQGLDLSFQGVVKGIARSIDNVIGFFRGLFDAIVIIFSRLPGVLSDLFRKAFDEVLLTVREVINGIIFLVNELAEVLPGVSANLIDPVEFGKRSRIVVGRSKDLGTEIGEAFLQGARTSVAEDAVERIFSRAGEIALERQIKINRERRQVTGQAERERIISAPRRDIADIKAQNDALKKQKEVLDLIFGPLNEYREIQEILNRLLKQGKIDVEQYNQALAQTELGGQLATLRQELGPRVDPQLAQEQKQYQTRLEALRVLYFEAKLILQEEYQRLSLAAWKQYNDGVQKIESDRAKMLLGASSQLFGSLTGLAKGFVGEQSEVYRALFAASKAFAVAEATIATYQAISKAAATGPPYNIALIAEAIAQTSGLVSQIASVTATGFQTGGQFRVGGSGNADSQTVMFRASPNETVSIRTPSQQKTAEQQALAPASQPVENKIINIVDPSLIEDALQTTAGEKALLNVIRRNPNQVNSILGRRR